MKEGNIEHRTLNTEHRMQRFGVRCLLCALLSAATTIAQVPDAQPAPQQPAAPPPAAPAPNQPATSSSSGPKFLGKDVPIFDPANEIVSWDGHNWNLNNNRIFEARFEKYLNA